MTGIPPTPDHELLDQLGKALAPPGREPAPERIAALRREVMTPPARPSEAGREAASTVQAASRRVPRAALAVLGVAAALLIGLLGGVALGDDLPRPVRAAAHAIGLPVDSPELVDARAELQALGRALAAGDLEAIRVADAEMVALVRGLDADERARIEPVAHEVHLRAVEVLGQADEAGGG